MIPATVLSVFIRKPNSDQFQGKDHNQTSLVTNCLTQNIISAMYYVPSSPLCQTIKALSVKVLIS
jgi:hypothetical protein